MENLREWNKIQESFFDQLSVEYGGFDFSAESSDSKRFSNQFIDFLELGTNRSVVEFGCGRGEWIIKLAGRGFPVTGIDISQGSLVVLRKDLEKSNLGRRVELIRFDVQGEIETMVGQKKFDTVYCYNLLHHVLSREKVVSNMVKVTAAGGCVVAYEPNPFHWWWYVCPFFDAKFKWSVEKGLLRTPPTAIKKIFEAVGLKRIEIVPVDYFPFIAPERTNYLTNYLSVLFSKLPVAKYLSAVYLIKGYRI